MEHDTQQGSNDTGGTGTGHLEERPGRQDPVLRQRHVGHDRLRRLRPAAPHRRHLREIQTLAPRRRQSHHLFVRPTLQSTRNLCKLNLTLT